MNEKEEQELKEMINHMKQQHEALRKEQGKEQIRSLSIQTINKR